MRVNRHPTILYQINSSCLTREVPAEEIAEEEVEEEVAEMNVLDALKEVSLIDIMICLGMHDVLVYSNIKYYVIQYTGPQKGSCSRRST